MNALLRRHRRRLNIQSRFTFTFGAVLVGIMMLVMLVASNRQRVSALGQIEKRGTVAAQSLSSVAAQSLLNYDYPSLQRLAEEIRTQTGAAYIVIHDKEHSVAGLSGRPELQGQQLSDPVSQRALAEDRTIVQIHAGASSVLGSSDGYDVLEVSMPVHVSGSDQSWGTVRVGISLAEMRRELASTLRDLALLGLFAVAVVFFSARFFTSRITGPLRELADATAVVATGQLDHRVKEDLVGELGDTARSFNKMTEDLRRSRDAIRYQNQHLENMVQERTAALRQKARELEKANAELKEVDRLKSDFLSNVSHELRTPLTSIRSFTEILKDQDELLGPEERDEFLEIIAGQTDRLTRLIGDLLDLSKIESGEFSCNVEALPLGPMVIEPCMETMRRLAEEHRITLESRVEAKLPPVLADGDRVSQVLTNLVANALKFTPSGGTVSVTAATRSTRVPVDTTRGGFYGVQPDTPEHGRYVVVSVCDTGIGIPEPDRQRIFEKFGQVGNVLTNKPQGTGLGLTISGNILSQQGGALWVESEVNVGSCFHFSVPVSQEQANLDPETDSDADHGAEKMIESVLETLDRATTGSRVLVVHSDPDIIQRLITRLEPAGFRAIGCQGGVQAAPRARDLRPDVIVLDALLSDVSGYDVLRSLKSDSRTADTPVVILASASEAEMARELGAEYHVTRMSRHRSISGPVPILT